MNINHLKAGVNEIRAQLISDEAERSVLGSVLIDNSCYWNIQYIGTHHFNKQIHSVAWEEATRMLHKGEPVDIVTLSDRIEHLDIIRDGDGFAYLADLAKNTPSAANVRAYAAILVDRHSRLLQARVLFSQLRTLANFDISANEHLQNTSSAVERLNSAVPSSGKIYRHIRDIAEEWSVEFEARYQPDYVGGLTLGLESLDNLLNPKQVVDGSLFVVGARPKMGKTALALKFVDHLTRQGHCTQVFSMEMTGTQLVERSLVQIGSVSSRSMYPKQGTFEAPDEELAKLAFTLGDLKDRDLHISVKPAVNVEEMERNIRMLHKESNGRLKGVFVDYLTLMDVDQIGGRTDLPYARITQRLKVVAKELNLVIFLLIQLNRSLESRPDKRPMPSDGRETGQIEQDCDYWLGIYRDHVYNPDADPNFVELLLRLNRHGNSGKAYASFAGGRFDDWQGQPPMKPIANDKRRESI